MQFTHTFFNKKNFNSPSDTGLKKSLRFWDLTGMGIAAIVGAGIFSTIGQAVVQGGPAVTLLFLFTAIACALSALCYAAFASSTSVSGSAYTYSFVSFGELAAWMVGWNLILEYAISNIAVAISWSAYFVSFAEGFGIKITTTFDWFGNTLVINYPAFLITVLVTIICYIGIEESKKANNFMVLLKIGTILIIIGIGAFYVQPDNWHPFAPNGVQGVLYGVSSVFFAYIGFDAISTTAEECRNPQKDMPRAMIASLAISTLLYLLITTILTGMVPYHTLGVADPLAFVFETKQLHFISGFVSLISIITLSSVMLVYQLGQPRIWMSMSRDGLMPKKFSEVHPKFKTPSFSTIIMGLMVGIPALFADLKSVIDLTSIGTLFAFACVCLGVALNKHTTNPKYSKFKIPYIKCRYYMLAMLLTLMAIVIFSFVTNDSFTIDYVKIFFYLISLIFAIYAIVKNLSLIPVLGVLMNIYLMTELGVHNWILFSIWIVLGFVIYALYAFRTKRLKFL
ncbi:MAG: amino acid permease [Bacteroidota bacterium]|nr:amino acid permease [Bacteroidota bacterium]